MLNHSKQLADLHARTFDASWPAERSLGTRISVRFPPITDTGRLHRFRFYTSPFACRIVLIG